ncbi:MAG TPA: hypothetical protein VKZ53_28755 [Candidatus Angelobacter sp.]|nr:hypothetical protein [Candidatus Angelobacter sp.]
MPAQMALNAHLGLKVVSSTKVASGRAFIILLHGILCTGIKPFQSVSWRER